jgi:hypothetical protein
MPFGGVYQYMPPPFAQLGGSSECVGVRPLSVFDPQRMWGTPHGACPVHGWAAKVKSKGWATARRMSGLHEDEWVTCRYLFCPDCHAEHTDALKVGYESCHH